MDNSVHEPKDFYIFGQNISFSMSPIIHTAAFKHHNLPYTYTILQTPSVDSLSHTISSLSFGGASVTMPHKIHIGKFCDRISEPAKAIGAINTLIISQDANSGQRMVTGENTDWSGLVESMKLSAPDVLKSAQTGLVIGAGGAARAALYALYQIGIRDIYLVNRTRANAEKITRDYAHLFRVMIVSSLFEVATTNGYRPDIIIGTIPADQTSVENFPETLFESGSGVCVDMSYKPRLTPLLKRASMAGGWVTVSGVSVLLEQGFLQSELWLRVPAPKDVMIRELEKHDRMTAEGMKV